MKSSKLGKFRIFRWFTRVFFGWKWTRSMGLAVDPNAMRANRRLIPKIWSPQGWIADLPEDILSTHPPAMGRGAGHGSRDRRYTRNRQLSADSGSTAANRNLNQFEWKSFDRCRLKLFHCNTPSTPQSIRPTCPRTRLKIRPWHTWEKKSWLFHKKGLFYSGPRRVI